MKRNFLIFLFIGLCFGRLSANAQRLPHNRTAPALPDIFGLATPRYCVETETSAACIDPDTPKPRMAEILRRLAEFDQTRQNQNFHRVARWSQTANGATGANGTPIVLTYSFVPDGTTIHSSGYYGDGTSPSNLQAALTDQFNSATLWKNKIREAFGEWSAVCGIRYIEVSDDGADVGTDINPGVLGVRGDIRISGHSIDGRNGYLAYDLFPNHGGDVVIDTDDFHADADNNYRKFRNTMAHELGHGLGLGHVYPLDTTKLMEPTIRTNTDGPQDDDIRGAQYYYGDSYENNNTAMTATLFPSVTSVLSTLSIHNLTDQDWFKLDLLGDTRITASAVPVGAQYQVGSADTTVGTVDTLRINRLSITIYAADGTTVLASGTAAQRGNTATATADLINTPSCYIKVSSADTVDDVQRYYVTASRSDIAGALYVDKNYVGQEFGTPDSPFRSVTTAVNAANSAFNRIYIRKGNYGSDRPRITKPLKLLNWFKDGQAAIGKP